jgi:AraC family transcriptional regulator
MKTITRESYAKRIENVLHYLVAHLDEPLYIHRLAEEAFLSPYHFHRVYVAMMGETVAETIRRHRLHRAAMKLSASATPVVELATEAGYGSVHAFTRAFRAAYGLPPAQFRLNGSLNATRQVALASTHASTLASGMSSPTHRPKEPNMFNLADVKIQDLPATRIAALSHHGDYQKIGETFGRLMAWAAGKGVVKADVRTFGIYYDDPTSKPKEQLRSEACLEIPATFTPDGDAQLMHTAGGRAAVFIFTGPYSELEKPYRWIYDTWLPQSGEEVRDAAPFEEYLNDARNTAPQHLKTAICIPLKSQ